MSTTTGLYTRRHDHSSAPETRLVFSGLLTIAIIGFMFDRAILALSSMLCRWHFRQADEFRTAA